MKRQIKKLIATLIFVSLASASAQAECFYSYKAKKENPLQLHFGVIKIEDSCAPSKHRDEIKQRLSAAGWTLLLVIDSVPTNELRATQEEAGVYFLRY